MLKSAQVTTKSRVPLGQNTFGFRGDGVGYQPTTTNGLTIASLVEKEAITPDMPIRRPPLDRRPAWGEAWDTPGTNIRH